MLKKTNINNYIFFISILIYLIICIVSISVGSVKINFSYTIRAILNILFNIGDISDISETIMTILINIRLPRVIMASIVGASLSLAGAVMQGLLKNPLADGSSLGVASGASIGATIAIALGITLPILSEFSIIIISIIFAFLSLFFVLYVVKKIDSKMSTNTVILAGVIFSMFASSVSSLILAIFSNDIKKIVFWTLGSLSSSSISKVLIILPIFLICVVYILSKISELNVFQIGEDGAKYLGVNTKSTKISLFIFSSVLVGMSVAMTGNIGFVGLVIPSIVRMVVKTDYKFILPFSMILGASFLCLTDLISRTIIAPSELPIGTVTSLFGAVIFVYILYNFKKRKGV
ncbi:MAG: iron ABC transporter permease [Clostridia bacterium]|nr:iron ABC transporter permease [Clostridia bacterium]MDD4387172.1 iron ABC transporter permease [Clostridia bacterium]